MNKYIISLSIIFFSLSVTPSWAGSANQKFIDPAEQLRWLYKANPEKDAKEAIAKGDLRLRAVYGYTLTVLGIKGDYTKYREIYGINPIEGTSDFLQNEEHGKLNALATKYAEKYNRVILKKKLK
ncbi:MAG: hypothetical protein Q7T83_12090 [Thermodesulfovibrionales bacterium]|nr:hypothetical protein [Thermodesulfovibrionales bacterium]MDP3110842.1 hypothetical protein [Thermodesulfovibrionales bacterium]